MSETGSTAVLSCGDERWVSKWESVGNEVACDPCGFKWRRIVKLTPLTASLPERGTEQ